MAEPKPCGTVGGYKQHIARGEPTCEPCRKANAAHVRQAPHGRARYKASAALIDLFPGEYAALLAAEGDHPRRRDRARQELARRHPQQMQRLVTDELARQALADGPAATT